MTVGERWRRIAIWSVVVAFFVLAVLVGVIGGDWSGLLGFAAWPIVGGVIVTQQPRNGVGWYLFGIGFYSMFTMWSLSPMFSAWAPAWLEALSWAFSYPFWAGVWLVIAIFPAGRPTTRLGWAGLWFAAVYSAGGVAFGLFATQVLESGRPNPLAQPALAGMPDLSAYGIPVIGIALLADLVLRWRRAGAVERLQYRWFVFGVVLMIVIVAVALGPQFGFVESEAELGALGGIATAAVNLPAITIGIAITRNGLYDIGRVVSRSVSYLLVTGIAVGVYAGVVLLASLVLPSENPALVAVATLIAAAVFLPLLRVVQRRLDRRFDRERYDAAQVVDAFGEKLRASVDPEATGADLVAAVERTLQPAAVGLWTAGESR